MNTSRAPIAALLVGLCTIAALPLPQANAQLSPKCERNGKRDSCAITPIGGATNIKQTFDMIMFADDTVYEVLRYNETCKMISDRLRHAVPGSSHHLATQNPFPLSTGAPSTKAA